MSVPRTRSSDGSFDPDLGPDIAARVRAGDEEAFAALFFAYHGPLMHLAESYLGSADAAEEVVQDTFFRLWERRAHWTVQTSVRAYLYAMVRNAAMHMIRHTRVRERYVDVATSAGMSSGMSTWNNEADTPLLNKEFDMALSRTVQAMPSRMQRAYQLRMWHGLSHAEIAEAMGISVKAVDRLMARARGRLNEALLPHL